MKDAVVVSLLACLRPGHNSRRQRLVIGTVLVLGIVGLGAATVARARLDFDESQHLHAAWLVTQGRVPYRDFWEHHMPLLAYMLAPVTRSFADRPEVYFAARTLMAVVAAATLGLVYVLGGRFGSGVGAAAVVILAVQPRFLQHSVQVRPDVPALVTWMATILMLVRWRESSRPGRLWAVGLLLGVTAAFTPKAVLLGLGVALVVLSSPYGDVERPPRMLRRLAPLAVGCALPLAILLTWLALAADGTLRAFWDDIVLANLGFPDFAKQTAVGPEGIGFALLWIAGVMMTFRSHGLRALQHPLHGPLLIPAAVQAAILLLPTTPAVYSYSWMPALAIVSLYAAQALLAAVERAHADRERRARAILLFAVIVALIVPLGAVGIRAIPRNRDNEADLQLMRRELAYACPGEPVLDGAPLAVFRPTAFRYPSLVRGLRTWIARGVIPSESLVDDLRRARAPVGVFDSRLYVAASVSAFISRYYVRTPDGLLLSGSELSTPGGVGESAVELLLSGQYEVAMTPGLHVTIDGTVAQPAVQLSAGRHRISWSGPPGAVRFAILPCAARQASRVAYGIRASEP